MKTAIRVRNLSLGAVIATSFAFALAFAGMGTAAAAANSTITLPSVDYSTEGKGVLTAVFRGDTPQASDIEVFENGSKVNATVSAQQLDQSRNFVVLVVDTSEQMNQLGRLAAVKAELNGFVQNKPIDERVAIVTFGNTAQRVVPPTTDSTVLAAAVDRLTANGDAKQADGVILASQTAADYGVVDGDMLLISVGDTDASAGGATTSALAYRTAVARHLHITAIGLGADTEYLNGGKTELLTYAKAGTFVEAATTADISGAFAAAKPLISKAAFVASWDTDRNSGGSFQAAAPINVAVKAGDVSYATNVNSGSKSLDAPKADALPTAPTTLGLSSHSSRTLALVLVGIAVALFVLAVLLLLLTEQVNLEDRITTWEQYALDANPEDGEKKQSGLSQLSESSFMKKAVSRTTEIAENRGILEAYEGKLEQAAITIRAGEAILFTVVGALAMAALGVLWRGPIFGVIFGFMTVFLANGYLNFKAGRRLKKFNSQLPDMLNLLSSSLRAGYSVLQALDAVAQEVEDPMGNELRRVITEAQLGRAVNDALLDVSVRMQSPDFEWAVLAINIQREVGGNLSELLDTVAETMIERERLRREINALTAEGRMSAYVLAFMPLGLGVTMYTMNSEYMGVLFNDGLGKILLGAAVVSQLVGLAWMRKMIAIKL